MHNGKLWSSYMHVIVKTNIEISNFNLWGSHSDSCSLGGRDSELTRNVVSPFPWDALGQDLVQGVPGRK